MILTIRQPAPEGTVFHEDAFAKMVGSSTVFDVGYEATISKAEVVDQGRAVLLTLDVPDLKGEWSERVVKEKE